MDRLKYVQRFLPVLILFFGFMSGSAFADVRITSYRTVSVNGIDIAYRESKGHGVPVVFVHGNSSSSKGYLKTLQSNLGNKYRLIAMDLPGHGNSGNAAGVEGYSVPAYADILVGFADKLNLENAVFVGWSLGGHVVLEASQYLPDARGFAIYGTPPVSYPLPDNAFLPSDVFAYSFTSVLTEEQAVAYVDSFFAPGYTDYPQWFVEDVLRVDPNARLGLGISVVTGNYTDEVVLVHEMNKPLMIVHGVQEVHANLEYIEALEMPTLWRGRVQLIEEAGHGPQWETPKEFVRLIRQFVKDVNRR